MFDLLTSILTFILGVAIFLVLFPFIIITLVMLYAAVLVSVYMFTLIFLWFPTIVFSTWTKLGKKQAMTPNKTQKKETK